MAAVSSRVLSTSLPRFLNNNEALQGVLASIEDAGDGLLRVDIGPSRILLPNSLGRKLRKLQGRRIEVAKIGRQYGCREVMLCAEA